MDAVPAPGLAPLAGPEPDHARRRQHLALDMGQQGLPGAFGVANLGVLCVRQVRDQQPLATHDRLIVERAHPHRRVRAFDGDPHGGGEEPFGAQTRRAAA